MAVYPGGGPQGSAARARTTARVLLLDPDNRILLMSGRLPGAPKGEGAWFTIGGGVEAGETPRQAAAREIVEETGFTGVRLGRRLWTRRLDIRDAGGPLVVTEHFFLAHCRGGEPSREGWLAIERDLIDDLRWWRLADLRQCRERMFPPDLADRLAALIAEEAPREPGGRSRACL